MRNAGPVASDLEWDYSSLAHHYDLRAPYHADFARLAAKEAGLGRSDRIADMGAGTGRVANAFAQLGYQVDAIEPCKEMSFIGRGATARLPVRWHSTSAEDSGLADATCAMVSFGSSFNVVRTGAAIKEAARLLRPRGHLVVIYNHRELDDPLQCAIESCIAAMLPGFDHGARRRDVAPALESGGLFHMHSYHELPFRHRSPCAEFVAGFHAHATLVRQAGTRIDEIIDEIQGTAQSYCLADGSVSIPFRTRIWIAGLNR
jgi:SAM-dependent methyltransferase